MINYKTIRLFLFTLIILITVFFNTKQITATQLAPENTQPQINQVTKKLPVYFFWGEGCPHCHAESIFLEKIKKDYPNIEIKAYEVYNNEENYKLLENMLEQRGNRVTGVPVTILGEQIIVGFGKEQISGAKIKQALDIYLLKNNFKIKNKTNITKNKTEKNNSIKYPFLGKINLNALSLPVLTVILGTLDGFNPCSMWALVVLITLLLATGSKKKLWIIGGTFIITSAISYFLFLTAWFNAFKFLGYIPIIKTSIGILAIGVGIYFLRHYIKKRKEQTLTCEVTNVKTQNKIVNRLQDVIQKDSMLMAVAGVIAIAFSVNLIELVCSAGIPAIYTEIISQNNLTLSTHYLYLLAYDFFYMLDDMVVLIIAAFTWKLLQNTGKYTKYSHLFGGILLLILGAIMLFNPGLLMFK